MSRFLRLAVVTIVVTAVGSAVAYTTGGGASEVWDPQPGFVLVDGNRLPVWSYASEPVVKGDDRVPAIAAASILAKVQRDNELIALDRQYPGYGFARHKGYPTAAHLAALRELGVTPVHRRSFAPVRELIRE